MRIIERSTAFKRAFKKHGEIEAALLDRLLHHAHIVQISGQSYRLKNKKSAGIKPVTSQSLTQHS